MMMKFNNYYGIENLRVFFLQNYGIIIIINLIFINSSSCWSPSLDDAFKACKMFMETSAHRIRLFNYINTKKRKIPEALRSGLLYTNV